MRHALGVDLPVLPPVKPMLAKSIADVPEGDYLYEPKWDGFRTASSSATATRSSSAAATSGR